MKDTLLLFKALSDMTRLRILKMLCVKPLCVCEIMSVLGMAQSTTSQHLRVLENAGFVEPSTGGTWTIYSLKPKSSSAKKLLAIIEDAGETPELKKDISAAKKADRNRIKNCC